MSNPFYRAVRLMYMFYHPLGLCFFRGLMSADYSDVYIKRSSPETVYGILSLMYTVVYFVVSMFYLKYFDVIGDPRVSVEVGSMFGYIIAVCILTRYLMFARARGFLQLLRDLCHLTSRLRRIEESDELYRTARVIIVSHSAVCGAVVGFVYFDVRRLRSVYPESPALSVTLFAVISAVAECYKAASFTVVFYWVHFYCEYFGLAFRSLELRVTRALTGAPRYDPCRERLSELDTLRRAYMKCCGLVGVVDGLLSPAVFFVYISTTAWCSMGTYWAIETHPQFAAKWFTGAADIASWRIFVGIIVCFTFVLMAFPAVSVTSMRQAADSVQTALAKAKLDSMKPEERQIISLFMSTCQSHKPSITGSSYFTVDRNIMIAIACTIVTYTVILIQTNTVGNTATVCCCNDTGENQTRL